MNIRQLKIFKAVCEEGSITKAADKLYISQPAVSTTIIELEDYVGFDLFDRISRNIILNEKGKLFLQKVNLLLNEYDDLHNSFVSIDENARLKIGSSITMSMDHLPEAIVSFHKEYPNTPVEVTVKNAEDIEEMVINHELDFGLVEGIVKNKQLEDVSLTSYEIIIVASPDHILNEFKTVTLDDLLKQDLLLREKGSAIRDVFDSSLHVLNKTVKPLWTSINSQSLINATLKNIGISVLPKILVEQYLKEGKLIEIVVDNFSMNNQNHIVYSTRRQSDALKMLISKIKEQYEMECRK